MLRHSQFNHITKVPDTEYWVLLNFASTSVVRLDAFQKELFEMAPDLPEVLPVIAAWKKAGFLTDIDEAALIRDRLEEGLKLRAEGKRKSSLTIKLYTTSACNFACPYCFQYRRGGAMRLDVQDAVFGFIESHLKTGRHNALHISWYGGEPLLEPEIIKSLSMRLLALADFYGIKYTSDITTNAWFLDQAMVDMLEQAKVRTAYITVDGVGEMHDRTRHLAGGGPTYQRIINNLRTIRTSMFISLRCNLHTGNLAGFEQMCDLVRELSAQTGNQIRLVPAKVEITPIVEKKAPHVVPVSSEDLVRAYQLSGYVIKKDVFHPSRMFCRGTDPFGFIIDEEGSVFPNCNNHAAEKKYSFGNLVGENRKTREELDRISFAHARSWSFPDHDPECLSCKFLVCCNGGCPSYAFERGKHYCLERIADPDSYAIMRYHQVFG